MAETPVLLLEGPRSVGKSLLLTRFAQDIGQPVLDLDQTAYRQLTQDNPSTLIQSRPPVIIDEYQRAPVLLDAIKAQLNHGAKPGSFVLAGSSSFDSLPTGTQALTGRLQRLAVMPLTQTEIDGAHLLRLSTDKMARLDPAALTEFGHLLESFVVQEAIRQTTWMDSPVTPGYWRTKDGVEVDLVLERHDGAVIGIEVRAGDHVPGAQLAPLRALRDRLGSSFKVGIVFYLGPASYRADDRIHVLPIDRLWR